MNKWPLIKERIKSKIRKPVSLDFAREDFNQITQKKDESIEDYGTRVRVKLKRLNESSRSQVPSDTDAQILYKVNEKQAISKFEQNLRNNTVKMLISAADKKTLDAVKWLCKKSLLKKVKTSKIVRFVA